MGVGSAPCNLSVASGRNEQLPIMVSTRRISSVGSLDTNSGRSGITNVAAMNSCSAVTGVSTTGGPCVHIPEYRPFRVMLERRSSASSNTTVEDGLSTLGKKRGTMRHPLAPSSSFSTFQPFNLIPSISHLSRKQTPQFLPNSPSNTTISQSSVTEWDWNSVLEELKVSIMVAIERDEMGDTLL
eukprot:Tbor_TRINITY_DN5534_c0_g2::TRINITY_DN5534_c0_g2_i2::g.12593::m.12593